MKNNRFSRREKEDDEEEGGWLDSYSDLVTDLLAVFVILFSFAMMNQAYSAAKIKEERNNALAEVVIIETYDADGNLLMTSDGVLDGDDGVLDGNEGISSKKDNESDKDEASQKDSELDKDEASKKDNESDEDEASKKEKGSLDGLFPSNQDKLMESINSYIDEVGDADDLSVMKENDNKIILRVNTSILFDSGRAEVKQEAVTILDKIGDILSIYDESILEVRIEGHTDNVPMTSGLFESNWELSSIRAVNVLKKVLDNTTLNPKKIHAAGYAEFNPIADNDTSAGRAKNRRVDFVIETADEKFN